MRPIGPMQVPQFLNRKHIINDMNRLCFREDFFVICDKLLQILHSKTAHMHSLRVLKSEVSFFIGLKSGLIHSRGSRKGCLSFKRRLYPWHCSSFLVRCTPT